MNYVLLFSCMFFVYTNSYIAQITVTNTSLAPEGTTWIYHSTGGNTPVTIPPGGPNQVWNEPTYSFGFNYTTMFVDPATTPYDTAFPSATHCVNTVVGGG